jgi:hypothetical protein
MDDWMWEQGRGSKSLSHSLFSIFSEKAPNYLVRCTFLNDEGPIERVIMLLAHYSIKSPISHQSLSELHSSGLKSMDVLINLWLTIVSVGLFESIASKSLFQVLTCWMEGVDVCL